MKALAGYYAQIDHHLALRIEGGEAQDFLHDLFCSDVKGLAIGMAGASALLTPQGKVSAFGLLRREAGERFIFITSRERMPALERLLKLYRLRRAVEIEIMRSQVVVSSDLPEAPGFFADPRDPELGFWGLQDAEKPPAEEFFGAADYTKARYGRGIAEFMTDFLPESVYPFDIGMDGYGALAQDKGCYIGQEVISRMIHRATIRRRPFILTRLGGVGKAEPGSVKAGGKLLGHYQNFTGEQTIAILRTDRLEDMEGVEILADGDPAEIKPVPYLETDGGTSS